MKKRGAKSSGLNQEDRQLWRRVTKTVSPLTNRNKTGSAGIVNEEDAWLDWIEKNGLIERTPIGQTTTVHTSRSLVGSAKSDRKDSDHRGAESKLAQSLERQSVTAHHQTISNIEHSIHRKIAKGRLPIDARLDLHHQTQDQAHRSLQNFLSCSFRNGHRNVLVITGKGRSPNSRGILRKMLPIWISTPPINLLVSAIRHASRDHGGEGAWYIRLKRPKPEKQAGKKK